MVTKKQDGELMETKIIEEILKRGNDCEIRNSKDGIVILEVKKKVVFREHREENKE